MAVAPNPGVFEEVDKWLKKLDVKVQVTVGSVDNYVYRVKYGQADILAMAIMQLYMGMFGWRVWGVRWVRRIWWLRGAMAAWHDGGGYGGYPGGYGGSRRVGMPPGGGYGGEGAIPAWAPGRMSYPRRDWVRPGRSNRDRRPGQRSQGAAAATAGAIRRQT